MPSGFAQFSTDHGYWEVPIRRAVQPEAPKDANLATVVIKQRLGGVGNAICVDNSHHVQRAQRFILGRAEMHWGEGVFLPRPSVNFHEAEGLDSRPMGLKRSNNIGSP